MTRTGEWIVFLAAVVVALGTLWRYVVRPTYRLLHKIGDAVEYVRDEMQHNGGATLRDAVGRIETKTGEIDVRLEALESSSAAVKAVVAPDDDDG